MMVPSSCSSENWPITASWTLGSNGRPSEAPGSTASFPLLALARVLDLGLEPAQGVEVVVPLPARGLRLYREHRRLIQSHVFWFLAGGFDLGVCRHVGALHVLGGAGVDRGALGLLYRPGVIPVFGVSLVLLAAQSSLVLLLLPRGRSGRDLHPRPPGLCGVLTRAPRRPRRLPRRPPPGHRYPWPRRSWPPLAAGPPGCRVPRRACGRQSSAPPACS